MSLMSTDFLMTLVISCYFGVILHMATNVTGLTVDCFDSLSRANDRFQETLTDELYGSVSQKIVHDFVNKSDESSPFLVEF